MAGALETLVCGSLCGRPRRVERAIWWRLLPIGVPPELVCSEDLIDAYDNATGVHALAAVNLETLRSRHLRRDPQPLVAGAAMVLLTR